MIRKCTATSIARLAVIASVLLSAANFSAGATEGEVRWRLLKDPSDLALFITDTDEATDHFGSPFIRCVRGISHAKISGAMNDELRVAYADSMAKDRPADGILDGGQNENAELEASYSQLDGWLILF